MFKEACAKRVDVLTSDPAYMHQVRVLMALRGWFHTHMASICVVLRFFLGIAKKMVGVYQPTIAAYQSNMQSASLSASEPVSSFYAQEESKSNQASPEQVSQDS